MLDHNFWRDEAKIAFFSPDKRWQTYIKWTGAVVTIGGAVGGLLKVWDDPSLLAIIVASLALPCAVIVDLFFSGREAGKRLMSAIEKKDQLIEKLESPHLRIDFVDNDESYFEEHHYSIRVVNSSTGKTANDVRVVIASVEPLGCHSKETTEACARCSGFQIGRSDMAIGDSNHMKTDIHAGDLQKYSVAWRYSNDGFMKLGNTAMGRAMGLNDGAYRVKLHAVANDCIPASATFVIGTNDSGAVIFEWDKSHASAKHICL